MWLQFNIVLQTSLLLQDLTIMLAAICFSIALLKLYNAYGRPRILLAMIVGIGSFVISALMDILIATSVAKWNALFLAENIIVTAGTILSAASMVIILRYLLSVAKLDPLTSVYNRRHLKEVLDIEIARSSRNNLKFTLLYCDIDNFKLINDQMGHEIGDVVLRHVAQKLSNNARASDAVARWGGDEFVILFPQTDIDAAQTLTERLNEEIGSMVLAGRQLSISSGLAIFPDDGDHADRLLRLADTRMYQRKKEQSAEANHPFQSTQELQAIVKDNRPTISSTIYA